MPSSRRVACRWLSLAVLHARWGYGERPDIADITPSPTKASDVVLSYLSEDYFPGMHILEPRHNASTGNWSLIGYRGGQLPLQPEPFNGNLRPVVVQMPDSVAELRSLLERHLGIHKREELQLDWALFDRQGHRIEDLEALRRTDVAFVLEIGVWMWPAVRVGFKQEAKGVGGGRGSAMLRTLSLRPKIFEVRQFLSDSEAQEVIELGEDQELFSSEGMMQSADLEKGTRDAEFRTSKQAWLGADLSPLMQELDERVANLTRVPVTHLEDTQLLRYGEDEFYHNHYDWAELDLYPDQKDVWEDHHMSYQDRLATVFWYLNTVPVGGETNFPKHGQPICAPLERGGPAWRHCEGSHEPPAHECSEGLKLKPRRGTVVMWYNFHASGRGDMNALHAGCPVGKGLAKWSANKWVGIKPQDLPGVWVDGHPAIERYEWKGDSSEDEYFNHRKCTIVFENRGREAVDIMWEVEEEVDEGRWQGRLEEGRSHTLTSERGHRFWAQAGERRSNMIECMPPHTDVRLTARFTLEDTVRREGEL